MSRLKASSLRDEEKRRFMQSPHAIIGAHWDHEPETVSSGAAVPAVFAGVSPATNPGGETPRRQAGRLPHYRVVRGARKLMLKSEFLNRLAIFAGACLVIWVVRAQDSPSAELRAQVQARVDREYPQLFELYKELHAHPELSLHEEKTGQRVADELKKAGLEVTARVGGHGVVGVLRNGSGPTILVRTDLDALPVKELTGLPYASRARAVDETGSEVDVMHA